MEEKRVNADEVISQLKKLPKMAFLCLVFGIIFLIVGIVGIVISLSGDFLGFALILTGFMFSLLFFGIVIGKVLKSKSKLKNINEFELKSELNGGCVSFDKQKTYFTQNYVISNYYYAFAIKYSDIVWIYRQDKRSQNGINLGADLMICLVNGKKEYTTYSDEFCDEIKKRNNDVFEGFTIENKKAYKEAVKNYKSSGSSKKAVPSENMVSPNELQVGVTKTVETESDPVTVLPQFGEEQNNQPKDMFDIDPLYKIPGMSNDNSDTTPSTSNFLLFNEGENQAQNNYNILNQNNDITSISNEQVMNNNVQVQPDNNSMFVPTNNNQVVEGQGVPVQGAINHDVVNNEQASSSIFVPTANHVSQQNEQGQATPEIKNESYDVNQIKNPFIN